MATPLEKTLKRELSLDGREFIVAISPDGIKLTLKGKRNGQELKWKDWVSGEAALALALNASLGSFARPAPAPAAPAPAPPAVEGKPVKLPTVQSVKKRTATPAPKRATKKVCRKPRR